jgi:hypothetical protein
MVAATTTDPCRLGITAAYVMITKACASNAGRLLG